MGGEAGVGIERRMHGVMGQMEEEGLFFLHCGADMDFGFEGEGFGEEDVLAVIFLQIRHRLISGRGFTLIFWVLRSVEMLGSKIAPGSADGAAGHIDIKAKLGRVRPVKSARRKVAFAHMDGSVAIGAQQSRQGDGFLAEALPIPVRRTVGATVVLIGVDPIGGAVPGGVLPSHEGDPGGGADAHGAEVIEADAPGGEALHTRRLVVVIERMALRFAGGIC